MHLKNQLRIKTMEHQHLQKELKRLEKDTKNFANNRIREVLKNVFSPSQIDKLMNPHKTKIKWTVEDIISAISLQNISLRAYRYLRENNYPLPGLSTIRKWTARISVAEGILTDVIVLMKYKAKSLSVFQKIVVLNIGEMNISYKRCQIGIIRGLFYKWMQPVYYSYDESITIDTIKEIISKLYNIGYIVVAITSIFESSNSQLWMDLHLNIKCRQQCYFQHPSNNNYKIFIFPDESFTLMLMRNQFLDNGFIINDKHINKECIEEIININRQLEGEEFHKITKELLDKIKTDKQDLSLVTKLFSKIVADEIVCYGQEGLIFYDNWKEVANLFYLIDKWIRLFRSKSKEEYEEGEEPYGLCLEQQNDILNKVEKIMRSINIDSSENLSCFQDQIILRCNSLQELFKYLQKSFSIDDFQIKYILTNRLSSNLLESSITFLGGKATEDYNSSGLKFQSRLRKCILGKYFYDTTYNQTLTTLEPCLIDFNERSDSVTNVKDVQKHKGYPLETAERMQKFLTDNNISKQKVHKSLLRIISKNNQK